MFDYDDLEVAEDVQQVSLSAPAQESLRSLVGDMVSRVDSIKARVDAKEQDRPHARRRQATDAVSHASLSFAEFLGKPEPLLIDGDGPRGLRVARSRTDWPSEAIQMVDCDEYLVVVTGEFRLEKAGEHITIREGQGIFLEAGERVTWAWDSVVQFITILLPERHQRRAVSDAGVQTEVPKSPSGVLKPLKPPVGKFGDIGQAGYIRTPPHSGSGESADTADNKEASESTPCSETDVHSHGGRRVASATSSPPPESAGMCELTRGASLSTFEQLADNAEKLWLRQEMEEREIERPARYGARHLNTPVVIVSSELNPWSKTGGLAMVVGSYAYEFAVRGHRTMAISPRYGDYQNCQRVGATKIWLAGQEHEVQFYHQRQDFGNGRGCDYIFVDHDCFHRPQGLYGDPSSGEYSDNCFRFSLLCIAAAEAPLVLNLGGSVYGEEVCFIANDWQTGMLPVYLNYKYKRNRTYLKAQGGFVGQRHGAMACPSEIPDDAAEFESHIVDAPRNIEGRAEQEAKWAGDYDGRQHWSLREAYLKHRDRLRQAQGDLYRVKMLLDAHFTSQSSCLKDLDLSILERIADFGFSQGPAVGFLANWRRAPKPVAAASDRPGIRFMARKRPLLPFEVAAGDWDCVTVSRSCARVVCHDGRLHRTGRRLEMLHKKFVLDQAYDSSVSDSEFYEDAVKPLVTSLKEEEAATIICYGQTGTGKTHTFNACWKRLGADLAGRSIAVTFFEIHGKKCYDLLQQRKEVTLRSDAEERVHVRGALTLSADAAALPSLLEEALRLRRSEATERNPLSSRSHAVCILALDGGTTTLRFVDLAGSERNYETRSMTAQQHRDFAEINKSLMALKDCFRAHAQLLRQKSTRVPYRSSSLTQVLRSCFTPEHRTLILATISPTATDLLHSTNSLLQVTQMSKALSALRSECCVELPLTSFMASRPLWEWSNEEVNLWIRTVNNGLFKYLVLPPKITGAMLLQLSSQGLAQLFDMSLRTARGLGEGEAWNEALASDVGQRVGKLLFAAVRREAMSWPLEVKDLPLQLRREAAEREMLEEGLGLPPEAERHCEFFFWGETVPPTE